MEDGEFDLTVSRERIAALNQDAEEGALLAVRELSGTADEPGQDRTSADTVRVYRTS